MVNEIKGITQNPVQNLTDKRGTGQVNRPGIDGGKQGDNAAAADNSAVKLTATADLLNALKAEIAKQPVVDTQRVDSIKQTVFDGTFQLNTGKTAEKMAEFEQLLDSKLSDK
ncbi:MAG: flagellar biosynthesis anti-sigma factor FlgM [Thiotrichales bacterium]|nr:flagellar biosynthesis anti-sigma factor FlgM [Thiotrichales bacterium]